MVQNLFIDAFQDQRPSELSPGAAGSIPAAGLGQVAAVGRQAAELQGEDGRRAGSLQRHRGHRQQDFIGCELLLTIHLSNVRPNR